MAPPVKYRDYRNPWDRRDGERDHQWQAFLFFRDLGPGRTIKRVAEAHNRSYDTYRKWAAQHEWKIRCHAWDSEIQRSADKAIVSEVGKLARAQMKAWGGARTLAIRTIARSLENSKETTNPPTTIRDACLLLDKATFYERLITGDATSRDDRSQDISTERLTPAEAEELMRLLQKAGYAPEGGEL